MRDRVSLFPGRVKLTPVAGQENTFDLVRADQPTDVGTELSKKNLLQDSTEISLFGSAADRTVDDAFAGIAGQLKLIMSDMAAITLTVQATNGKPIPGVLVQGILSENGQAVYTNANGVATGYIGAGSQTIKVSGYADVVDYSEVVSVVKGTTFAKTIKLTTQNFLAITASKSIKFSGNVETIDYSITAGGGGGGLAQNYGSGGGAGGGTVTKQGVAPQANVLLPAIIGAGGPGGERSGSGTEAGPGGESSFMGDTAPGGRPGTRTRGGFGQMGGGSGGSGGDASTDSAPGNPGYDSTAIAYISFTETSNLGGGGGGGPTGRRQSRGLGGTVGGGKSGYVRDQETGDGIGGSGEKNTGGGGGGAGCWAGERINGGAGGSGFIGIRMHLKSA